VLAERYGFQKRVLLKSEDSLLIYYAGHGELDHAIWGSWLPVNADRTNNTEWISDQTTTSGSPIK